MTATTERPAQKRSISTRLYHGETDFDFVGRWKLWFAISGTMILARARRARRPWRLNLGIDFTGGNVWEVPANGQSVVATSRTPSTGIGISDAKVQRVGGDLRVQTPTSRGPPPSGSERSSEVVSTLAELERHDRAQVEPIRTTVGPSWGEEISDEGAPRPRRLPHRRSRSTSRSGSS